MNSCIEAQALAPRNKRGRWANKPVGETEKSIRHSWSPSSLNGARQGEFGLGVDGSGKPRLIDADLGF
jgi:hypothetical protein